MICHDIVVLPIFSIRLTVVQHKSKLIIFVLLINAQVCGLGSESCGGRRDPIGKSAPVWLITWQGWKTFAILLFDYFSDDSSKNKPKPA